MQSHERSEETDERCSDVVDLTGDTSSSSDGDFSSDDESVIDLTASTPESLISQYVDDRQMLIMKARSVTQDKDITSMAHLRFPKVVVELIIKFAQQTPTIPNLSIRQLFRELDEFKARIYTFESDVFGEINCDAVTFISDIMQFATSPQQALLLSKTPRLQYRFNSSHYIPTKLRRLQTLGSATGLGAEILWQSLAANFESIKQAINNFKDAGVNIPILVIETMSDHEAQLTDELLQLQVVTRFATFDFPLELSKPSILPLPRESGGNVSKSKRRVRIDFEKPKYHAHVSSYTVDIQQTMQESVIDEWRTCKVFQTKETSIEKRLPFDCRYRVKISASIESTILAVSQLSQEIICTAFSVMHVEVAKPFIEKTEDDLRDMVANNLKREATTSTGSVIERKKKKKKKHKKKSKN